MELAQLWLMLGVTSTGTLVVVVMTFTVKNMAVFWLQLRLFWSFTGILDVIDSSVFRAIL
jgi:hypothetical protein